MNGFIKLYRQFIKWEWYTDNNTKILFLHLLLIANYEDTKYQGMTIKKGQVLTSLRQLSKDTKLSMQNIRTSLEKLKLTQEVTQEVTQGLTQNKSLITLVNWGKYQSFSKSVTQEVTQNPHKNQHTGNTLLEEEIKNNNKLNNIYTHAREKKKYGEFENVLLTDKEYQKLIDKHGKSVVDEYIEKVSGYCKASGKKYKDYYATVQNWLRKDKPSTKKSTSYSMDDIKKKLNKFD